MKLFKKRKVENADVPQSENPGGDRADASAVPGKSFFSKSKLIMALLVILLVGGGGFAGYRYINNHFFSGGEDHGTEATSHQDDGHTAPKAEKSKSHTGSKTASGNEDSAHKPKLAPPVSSHGFTPPGKKLGLTFVEAAILPMEKEFDRWWGWRPNDIINVTDNVNNFQLGVLEVTRRTAVALAENISRTGSTDAYVPSLEAAMNWFMIKPTKYWFPSAESKYKEGLEEWREYMRMLQTGEARFFRRVDNLVPLFKAYESILGSCDENLVKNLGELSYFKADDYFYYTKGVASAMGTILEAAAIDFHDTVTSVQGADVLHHAIESLKHASHMSPWLVLESKPDSILANHRANMAAPISHARFYLGVLNVALTGNIQ